MAYGDGSIVQVSRGVWKVRVDFGKDPISGKRRVVSRNVRGTKADARKVRDHIKHEKECGIKVDARNATLSSFIPIWGNARLSAGTAEETTVKEDMARLKHIERYLGNVPMADINARDIEHVYSLIREEGKLGGTSMNHIHVLLKSVFRKAVDYDLVLRNPCDKVTAPKKDSPNRRALSASECTRLALCLDKAEQEHRRYMEEKEQRRKSKGDLKDRSFVRGVGKMGCIQCVRIALATGMRRGEILGLEWGSVDLEKGIIFVTQSRTKYNTNKEPKTKAGVRAVHIDQKTLAHLRSWKADQTLALEEVGLEQDEHTPVCCSDKGTYMDLPNFERFWRAFKSKYGFVGLRFHELRHTQATRLLASGVDVKTVQTRMGHANSSITLDWYAHPSPENDVKAACIVGSLLEATGDGEGISLAS